MENNRIDQFSFVCLTMAESLNDVHRNVSTAILLVHEVNCCVSLFVAILAVTRRQLLTYRLMKTSSIAVETPPSTS